MPKPAESLNQSYPLTPLITGGLFPHQVEAVGRLAQSDRYLLADDQGLGKTIVAIRAADALSARRILVVAPVSALRNWQREFLRFQTAPRTVGIVTSKAIPDTDVLLISTDLPGRTLKTLQALLRLQYDVLIIDECQSLKSPKSKRTRAVYGSKCTGTDGLVSRADAVWALSGTPAPNHPGELWAITRALWPKAITNPRTGFVLNEWAFTEQYCVTQITRWGRRVIGGRNLPELKDRLQPYFLRRKKEDVLKDLPPRRIVLYPLEPTTALRELRAAENTEAGKHLREILQAAEAKLRLKYEKPDLSYDEKGDLVAAIQRADHELARLWHLTGLAKADAAVRMLDQELEDQTLDKVVIFARHREVLRVLHDGLGQHGVVQVDGSTPGQTRQTRIDAFQTDPDVRVFLGQIDACSTAITLTAASNVVLVEYSWTPATNLQAIDRCHRIGQRSAVLARFLCLSGSLDEAVTTAIQRKTAMINQIF
jgi:SWI/SNF-related matrix-associated actin-dependent regulator 1 of chromatin subfamily A